MKPRGRPPSQNWKHMVRELPRIEPSFVLPLCNDVRSLYRAAAVMGVTLVVRRTQKGYQVWRLDNESERQEEDPRVVVEEV